MIKYKFMRYLVVFMNGHKEEIFGCDWMDVNHILNELIVRVGVPPDLIYMLDLRRTNKGPLA